MRVVAGDEQQQRVGAVHGRREAVRLGEVGAQVPDTRLLGSGGRARERELRFSELRESIEGISEKMLSQTLRTLARDGLVWRDVEPSTPPKVTYGLTPLGRGTSQPLARLFGWIRDNATVILAVQAEFDAH